MTLDGQRTEYVYEQGRLVSITRNSQPVSNRTYDNLGNLVSERFANGITEARAYDSRSQLSKLTIRDASNAVVKEYEYKYDVAGRLIQERESSGETRSYRYDADGQLIQYMLTNGSSTQEHHTYEYDASGNVLRAIKNGIETRWEYDSSSKLITQLKNGVSTTYSYDANGNLLRAVEAGVEILANTWDARGRLVRVRTSENGTLSNVEYTYDYSGLMIRRVENGVVTDYVYDRSGTIPKLVRSTVGGVHEYYTHAERVLARSSSGSDSFYHLDAAGNTRFQTSAQAEVRSRLSYTPFGELSLTSIDQQAEGQSLFQFAGELFDPTTNLTYLRQRHYKPTLSRFVSADSFHGFEAEPLSQNPYQYAYNSPLVFKDPSGEYVPSIAELKVATSLALTITAWSTIQVLMGTGGVSGREFDYAGPFLSLGFGLSAGVGFSMDLYTGLLASSDPFAGGPDGKNSYRLSGGVGATFGFGAGLSANYGGNAGSIKVGLNLNLVTRLLGGAALSGAMVIADVSVQTGVGQSPWAYMTLGFAKGTQNGGGSVGPGAGVGVNYKTGIYVANSVAVDKEDSDYIRALGDKVGSDRFGALFDQAFAKFF